MTEDNKTPNNEENKYDILGEVLEKIDPKSMLDFTKRVNELVDESKNLKGTSAGGTSSAGNQTNTKPQHVTKSNEEIQDIIGGMLRVAGVANDSGNSEESRFKVPALRFSDLKKLTFADKKKDIEDSGKKLWDVFKLKIRLIKSIDTIDITKDKYVIEFTDNNNNRVTFDYLEYQKKIYDFTVDEEQLLQNEIVKLRGTYDSDVVNAAKEAANYISLCLAFNEMLVYKYKYIGWQAIYHSRKENEYINVYRKDIERARDIYGIYQFKIDYQKANAIENKKVNIELLEESIEKRNEKVKNALHLKEGKVIEKYPYGEKELVFKYNKLYAHGINNERIGFCGERWAESIDVEVSSEEKKYTFNEFFAHTFNNSTKASLVLCAAVSGVLRQLLELSKEYGININILGEAASGKSTLQNLVLSFFGDPNGLAASFIDSDNAKEEERVARVFIPYIIDDKLLDSIDASDNKRGVEAFLDIFREYEGRNKQKAGLKSDNTHRFYGAVISSSVESIFELIEKSRVKKRDLGQVRRLIELKINKDDVFKKYINSDTELSASTHAETATEVARRYYGYGVPQIIDYMYLMMKYQYIYHLFLAYDINLKDTFKLVDKIIRLMERKEDSDLSELINYCNECNIDSSLIELVAYIIKDKITLKMDENNEEVFRSLLRVVEEEMEEKIESLYDAMTSSKQRFSLIALTGYIINYAFSYTEFKRFKSVDMNMDIDGITDELIKNLKEKLERYNLIEVLEDKATNTPVNTSLQPVESVPTVKDIINIYDWLISNYKYFYIDKVGSNQSISLNSIDKFIGRIQVEDGVGLKLAMHSTSKIKVINTIFTCDNIPENILKYIETNGKDNSCGFVKDTYIEEMLKNYSNLIHILGEKGKNITINKQGGRGIELVLDIDAIEEARASLNQQSKELAEPAEKSNQVAEQSQEVVDNTVEEPNQEETTNETN